MTDLTTTYLGLSLRSPLVPSASPLTGDLASLHQLEDAGAAAVVLPSLFEEQLVHDALEVHERLEWGTDSFSESSGWFPTLDDYNTGPERYLGLIERAKAALRIPVIASLNAATPGGWIRFAKALEQAGADAIELNLYSVEADPSRSGADVENEEIDLVAAVRSTVGIPVAVKLSPFYTAFANVATRLAAAGADGLVLFNRFYQPDLDIHSREVVPRVDLSVSTELRLPLRWIAILRGRVGAASLAATTGVHTAVDVAKVLLAGADVAMLASALLRNGPGHLALIEAELEEWMAEEDYTSVAQLQGSASQQSVFDPSAFERANYLKTLTSYRA